MTAMPDATQQWWYEFPSGQDLEICAYTPHVSYRAGEPVAFHVHTTAGEFSVAIYRDGAQPTPVFGRASIPGSAHRTPPECYRTGCGWPGTFTITDTGDWPSGGYIAVFTASNGPQVVRHEHWFAVAPDRGDPARLLLVAATSTWAAYNAWGGANHYEGVDGPTGDRAAATVSFERPWSRGIVSLPVGAPRKVTAGDVPIGWVPRYPTIEWALATGYPKYTASAGWATYERHFVCWAESHGYDVDVVAQHDLHHRPEILAGYGCVVMVGHDEYWSWEMRDAIDAFVDAGGGVVRLAGNFLWQVRLEDAGRRQTCHKYTARENDPFAQDEARRTRLTSCWDDRMVGRPGAQTFGTTATRGLYAKCFAATPRASGGFVVYRPRHWTLAGTDLYYGDQFGAAANVFGYEVDGLAYTIRDGLPHATGDDGVDPADVDIVAMNVATLTEEDHGHPGTQLFAGDDEARFIARVVHDDESAETIERISRGSGMMVAYRRGRGEVFNASSCEWVNGLRLRDPFTEQITHNVLKRYLNSSGRATANLNSLRVVPTGAARRGSILGAP
jgi:N,N-dimethylformamidase beta subunit-like protein